MLNIFRHKDAPTGYERDLELTEAIGLGVLPEFRIPTPPPVSATDRLQRNLERTVSESTARAEVLRQEIAAREAELADVLRAEEAARIGMEALDDRIEEGPFPADEPVMAWPFDHINCRSRVDRAAPITDEDLTAACGLALEAEMREKPAPWLMPDDIAAEGDRANGK